MLFGFSTSSPWQTSKRSNYLRVSREIMKLAKIVLCQTELAEAETLSKMLVGSKKEKKTARDRLARLVAPPPKRPFYYCSNEITFLPRWTRDSVRYLGDYIDLLAKHMTFEFTGKKGSLRKSLGKNIYELLQIQTVKSKYGVLLEILQRYNSLLYNPSKHDFYVPFSRPHRFTSKEVVLDAFITMKLAEQIKLISKNANIAASC